MLSSKVAKPNANTVAAAEEQDDGILEEDPDIDEDDLMDRYATLSNDSWREWDADACGRKSSSTRR